MRVLLLSGRLSEDDLPRFIDGLQGADICGVVLSAKGRLQEHLKRGHIPVWTHEQLAEEISPSEPTPLHDRYELAVREILSDERSFYLIERVYGRGGLRGAFNGALLIERAVWNSLTLLHQARPDRIVGTNTPHNVDWFLCRIAQTLGIAVVFTQTSPLPWRTWVVAGLDEQNPILRLDDDRAGQACAPSSEIGAFVRQCRSSYSDAMPAYERRRMERYKGRFSHAGVELQVILGANSWMGMLWNTYAIVEKRAALRAYNRHAANFVAPDRYVAMFLHFQPERSTLPEGYRYAQQWFAIRALASALPRDWTLVIKEHPSTFRGVFSPEVRNAHFYDSIAALPNVRLAPLELSSFELLDSSQAVATVTGRVGVEAIIRGKPVLTFGAAQYRGAQGVFGIRTIPEAQLTLARIAAGYPMPTDDELLRYFAEIEHSSFPRDARLNGSIDALLWAIQCTVPEALSPA